MVLQQIVWVAVACVTQATSIWQTPNRHFYSFWYDIGLTTAFSIVSKRSQDEAIILSTIFVVVPFF